MSSLKSIVLGADVYHVVLDKKNDDLSGGGQVPINTAGKDRHGTTTKEDIRSARGVNPWSGFLLDLILDNSSARTDACSDNHARYGFTPQAELSSSLVDNRII